MAVNHEIKQAYGPVGYYNRIIAEDGDTVTLDFANADFPKRNYPTFTNRVTGLVTPTGTTTCTWAMRPDYEDADFAAHPDSGSFSAATRFMEDGHLAALRFAASGGDMTIEFWSANQVKVVS